MATVVLLGFSTTGKSTILGEFVSRYSNNYNLEIIDTDKQIPVPEFAKTEDEAHIYLVFNNLVKGQDRSDALKYIKRREQEILESFQPVKNPRLIAAGPALPSRRPEWLDFITRVNPVCFFLKKTPEEVYEGLLKRRKDEKKFPKKVRERADFGSWDEDTITEYKNGRWIKLPKKRAIKNIEKHMGELEKIYEEYSSLDKVYSSSVLQTDPTVKKKFYDQIREALGLPE